MTRSDAEEKKTMATHTSRLFFSPPSVEDFLSSFSSFEGVKWKNERELLLEGVPLSLESS
jgi:hypothetical protein